MILPWIVQVPEAPSYRRSGIGVGAVIRAAIPTASQIWAVLSPI